MPQNPTDVLVLGNAIVDIIARTDDDFLRAQDLRKGGMQLIDEARAEDSVAPWVRRPSSRAGRAPIRRSALRRSGSRAGFIGKVRDDELGRLFAHDLRAIGVDFNVAPAADGAATARCFILVTPDGERTMNTYLGACQALGPDDVDPEAVEAAPRSSTSKAIYGIRRPPRRRSARPSASRTRRATPSRSRCRTPSASTATGTSSWGSCATAASTSCSPTSTS